MVDKTAIIKIKRNSTASATPSSLAHGELAANTADNKLFIGGPSGTVSQLAPTMTEMAAKAPLASPNFTGTPTAPTAAAGNNTTQVATTAFVTGAVSGKLDKAGGDLTGTLRTVVTTATTDFPANGSAGPFQVMGDAVKSALMAFHRAGTYAVYLGLGTSDNHLRVGGWSMGAVSYKLWHEGNDGTGSGLDADTIRATTPGTFGLSLLSTASNSAARTALGLGTAAVLNTGRNIDDVIKYESYQGVRSIISDGQVVFSQGTSPGSYAVGWQFRRNATVEDLTEANGSTNANLVARTVVSKQSGYFEWVFLSELIVNAPSNSAEHVAIYPKVTRNANAAVWGIAVELDDNIYGNPTKAAHCIEAAQSIPGPDPNKVRVGTMMLFKVPPASEGNTYAGDYTQNQAFTGYWMRCNNGKVQRGFAIDGNFDIGIDFTECNITHSDKAIALRNNHRLLWYTTVSYVGGVASASFAWNSTLSTFTFDGVATSTSATGGSASALPSAPVGYASFQINGTVRKFAYYN